MERNEWLRAAMSAQQVTTHDLAKHAQVDVKSVERWLAGTVPHRRHRVLVASILTMEETHLWTLRSSVPGSRQAELMTLYPERASVPRSLWWELITGATDQIDILAYAALFLPEQYPRLVSVLGEKGTAGCRVRLALGDPGSEQVSERGLEEGFNEGMAARVEMALAYYRPLVGCPGVEIAQHRTTLYNSIYQFDDQQLVNTHIWGNFASRSPTVHLRRLVDGGLFDTYAASFEEIWSSARPVLTDLGDR